MKPVDSWRKLTSKAEEMVSKVHTDLIIKVVDAWCSLYSRTVALFV